jgi:hypothetical protein
MLYVCLTNQIKVNIKVGKVEVAREMQKYWAVWDESPRTRLTRTKILVVIVAAEVNTS